MRLTPIQIQEFTKLAKAAGLNDNQIKQAIADRERELQGGGTIDVTQQQVSNVNNATSLPAIDASNLVPEQKSGNIVTNTAKAIVDPALKFGSYVAESVAQASRAVVDPIHGADVYNKRIEELGKQSRALVEEAKREKDKTKKVALLQKSRAIDLEIEKIGNEARKIGDKKKTFIMKDEEAIADRGKIIETGVKRTAGAASYAIPGSVGTGATVAGTIGRAAGAGAIAGGLQGLGASEGKDLEGTIVDTTTGALVGGATAGAFSTAGQVIKAVRSSRANSEVGKKLSAMGTDFKKSAYVKSLGRKPILREGGDKLLDKMLKAGIKPGSPDEVIYQADDILMDNAGIIFDKADEFKQKGVTIDKQKVLDPLERKLASAPAKSKSVIEKVLNFVKEDLDKFDEFTPAEAYAMKGDYGPFGNWTSTMDSDAVTEAKLWEEIYTNLNGLMDESFKKGGYEDFRAINDVVSTAINAKKYASRAGNVAPNLNTLGLMDVLAGGAGLSAGGVPTAIATMAGKKVLNSPKFASTVGGVLENAGASLSKNAVSNQQARTTVIGDTLSRLAQRGLVDASTGSGNFIENPNENLNANSNQETLNNSGNNEPNQNNIPFLNNKDIVSQPMVHPDPKFRNFKSKQEMVQAAFDDGVSAEAIEVLKERWDANAPQSPGIVSEDTRKIAGELRSEYLAQTKENKYMDAVTNYRKIVSTPETPAGDVSLIFAYMKLLDPTSVVRESEQSIAQNATSLPGQLQNYATQVANGKRLNPQQRAEFRQAAETIFSQYQTQQKQIDDLYSRFSMQYGVDPSLIGIGAIGIQ